jgi:2'-5' RNA ligase
MPRLFTALELPADVGFSLSMLRGGLPGARWIDPENYHITLRFIGDVDERTADAVDEMLAEVRREPITIRLNGLSSFGSDKPRSIYAAVEPSRQLGALQSEIERTVRRLGLAPEARKFVPHVSLARLRHASTLDVADYLAMRGYFPPRSFIASRFVLFSSRDSVGGGPYVLEAAYPLGQEDMPVWPARRWG